MRYKKGTVVSDKMNKTVVVEVATYKIHPLYKKRYKVTTKFKAHDETEKYKVDDEVTIYETRPVSKTKTWSVDKPKAKTK
jgi:small subunit ribosomal protein S17